MAIKKHKVYSYTHPSDNDIKYTIDTVPRTLMQNQFYSYNKKGDIKIGKILGRSAKNRNLVYEISGIVYKVSMYSDLRNGDFIGDFNRYYDNYKDFFESYTRFLNQLEEKKKLNRRKYRYGVNKTNFFCKKTSVDDKNHKYFDDKNEALKFAEEGIAKLSKEAAKLENNCKELLAIVNERIVSEKNKFHEIHPGADYDEIMLRNYQAIPSKVNVGDILFKVDYAKGILESIYLYFTEIVPNCEIVVTQFINKTVAKLSNGSILLEEEVGNGMPMIIPNDKRVDAELYIRHQNLSILRRRIEELLDRLVNVRAYCKTYKPLQSSHTCGAFFNKSYINQNLKVIEKVLNE